MAIVGCGAIGAAVARLLAQAGVGELLLVDGDELTVANASRHPLGIDHVGLNKATAMAAVLRRQLPHLTFEGYATRFERLKEWQRSRMFNQRWTLQTPPRVAPLPCEEVRAATAPIDLWGLSTAWPPAMAGLRVDDRGSSYGLMFWLRWNKLLGSYLRLIDASLS